MAWHLAVRRQPIIWTNSGILLIPLGTKFREILIEIYAFSFKKVHFKMLSGKWWPFCLCLNVLSAWSVWTSLQYLFPPVSLPSSISSLQYLDHVTWRKAISSHRTGPILSLARSKLRLCLANHRAGYFALSKLRLCSANHRPGYWSNLPCDWPSTAWAYSEQETSKRRENGPWSSTAISKYDTQLNSMPHKHMELRQCIHKGRGSGTDSSAHVLTCLLSLNSDPFHQQFPHHNLHFFPCSHPKFMRWSLQILHGTAVLLCHVEKMCKSNSQKCNYGKRILPSHLNRHQTIWVYMWTHLERPV